MAAAPVSDKPQTDVSSEAAAPRAEDDAEIKHAIESDHYAWAKDMKGREVEELSPAQLDAAREADAGEEEGAPGSAWNTAGTWEDQDISEKAQRTLKETLLALRAPVEVAGSSCVVVFREVTECSGSATVVFVRGRIKPGFELKLKAKWAAVEEANADDASAAPLSSGSLEIEEMTDYEDAEDYEMEIEAEEGTAECMEDAKEALCEAITTWKASLAIK